jgi:hypothetical protein
MRLRAAPTGRSEHRCRREARIGENRRGIGNELEHAGTEQDRKAPIQTNGLGIVETALIGPPGNTASIAPEQSTAQT